MTLASGRPADLSDHELDLLLQRPADALDALDRLDCEESLLGYMKRFWHVLEPGRPLSVKWPLEAITEHLQAITEGKIKRLLITVPPGWAKSITTDSFWPSWEWGPRSMSNMRYVTFSYSSLLTLRDNGRFKNLMLSHDYAALFGDRFALMKTGEELVSNDKTGWKLASSVGGVSTGARGDRVILDDPHNIKEGESDTIRLATTTWFKEAMQNRLNNENSAIVVIMQRVHEEDVAGVILSEMRNDYEHLSIPYEWEGQRLISTVPYMKWNEDPRTELGEEAWPERLPLPWKSLKTALGPYACNPGEAPILMGDLSMRPIRDVRVGDVVVGFDKKQRADDKKGRMKLTQATVTAVQSRVARVVKLTLDSGEVIRCTPDHRWFRKDRTSMGRDMYGPAVKGRTKLARICPSKMPELVTPQDFRAAGWLAGFFDGEGSVSLIQHKEKNELGGRYRAGAAISFYQTAERNLPICERLERELDHLGFEWSYANKIRGEGWQVARHYRLVGNTLPMYQKFLHLVSPTKWRDRILAGAFGAKFILGRERVIDIQPDGEEVVYALTTTTGNYVAWGFASSNCAAQYQQTPTPRGGGIFKRNWWQDWDPPLDASGQARFPACKFIVASLDGAFGQKQENDYTALTVWGVFENAPGVLPASTRQPRHYLEQVMNSGQAVNITAREARNMRPSPRIILMHAWRKRLPLNGEDVEREPDETDRQYRLRAMQHWGIVQWTADTCRRFRIDRLLIEAKANGIDVANEIQRQYRGEAWGVELVNPGRLDKTARAYSVQHLFADGMVFAPLDREWADEVVTEMSVFPKTAHDDYTDTATQALKYLRDIGLAQHQFEVDREFAEELAYKPPLKPLYPV